MVRIVPRVLCASYKGLFYRSKVAGISGALHILSKLDGRKTLENSVEIHLKVDRSLPFMSFVFSLRVYCDCEC